MTPYSVLISAPAENDLRDIVRYISAQLLAPMTAAKMMDAIEAAIAGLVDMPQKFPLVTDERLASMGYRKFIVKSYMVFYTIDEKSKVVDIIRIVYARRDWLQLL
jgi:plasmid stabilization system protein ParE